jgi:hypothetical protein
MKDSEGYTNYGKVIVFSWIWRLDIVKMFRLLKMFYSFKAIKIPLTFFIELEK